MEPEAGGPRRNGRRRAATAESIRGRRQRRSGSELPRLWTPRAFAGATAFFGWREAGYEVVRPVLLFNTLMGFVYLGAALLIARDLERGRLAALANTLMNLAVLALIVARRVAGGVVADETLVAMTARFAIWAAIAIVLTREKRFFAAAAR